MNWETIFQQQLEKANPEIFKPEPICHTNPFTNIRLWVHPEGGTIVEWNLLSTFQEPDPYYYQLQISYSENANELDWTTVAEGENTFFLVNPQPETYALFNRAVYRLRLLIGSPTNPTKIYETIIPSHFQYDIRSRKIIRRKLQIVIQNLRRSSGAFGLLYKRRYYGPKCPRCSHILSNEPTDGSCEQCFGTGKLKGFYDPIVLPVDILDHQYKHELSQEGLGTIQGDAIQVQTVAFPECTYGDVWRNLTNNTLWWIENATVGEAFRGYPIISNIIMHKIPPSSPLYHMPTNPQLELDFLKIPTNLT